MGKVSTFFLLLFPGWWKFLHFFCLAFHPISHCEQETTARILHQIQHMCALCCSRKRFMNSRETFCFFLFGLIPESVEICAVSLVKGKSGMSQGDCESFIRSQTTSRRNYRVNSRGSERTNDDVALLFFSAKNFVYSTVEVRSKSTRELEIKKWWKLRNFPVTVFHNSHSARPISHQQKLNFLDIRAEIN